MIIPRLLFALMSITSFSLLPGTVAAHAELDRSLPEADAVVTAAPELVEIWFTQEVAAESTIDVKHADGESMIAAAAELDLFDPDRKHMTVQLNPDLPLGQYTVEWTSISAEDDDTASGSFTFTIDAGTPVASPIASPIPATPEASPVAYISGQLTPDETRDFPTGDLLIAIGVGAAAACLIYGFWLLVKPRNRDK